MRVEAIRVRRLLCLAAIGATVSMLAIEATATASGVATARCHEKRWCTVTASGDVTQGASQLAIGNVSAGTPLAVTEVNVGQQQLGGQVLSGSLVGACVWSQYQRDWSSPSGSASAGCADPVLDTNEFVADNGTAVWSGCYPRCFGGVPLRHDVHCGTRGRTFCYSKNCEEYANLYPWSPGAHPTGLVRWTSRHLIDVRYLALYPDAQPFYMVRDTDAVHGTGNWVFIDGAACGVTVGHAGAYYNEPRHQ